MGWISATDLLPLGGLRVVGSVFRDFPRIEWITGRATWFNEQGMTVGVLDIPRWSRYRFLAGANRYIQQESTYWRRSLWEKAGSRTESSCRNGADFELWIRFFRHARLYSVDALIGGYRLHRDALGFQDLEAICRTHDAFIEADLETAPWGRFLRLVRRISQSLQRVPKIRALWNRAILPGLYRLPGPDIPPVIRYRYDQDQWKINR
jgi:hypothetical protein